MLLLPFSLPTQEEFVALVKLLKRPDVDADKLLSLFENVEVGTLGSGGL